jgi:glutathione S-transferase
MAEFRLHCFAQSGNAYKAALALNLMGLDWEPVFVDFFKGETRAAPFRDEVNAMGEAPVLDHGAVRLTQSGVILDYLADLTGRFGGRNAQEKREIRAGCCSTITNSPPTWRPTASCAPLRARATGRSPPSSRPA